MCINNKSKLAEKIKEERVAGGTLEEMYVNLWALGVPTIQQRDPQVWGEGPTSPWVVLWPEPWDQWTGDVFFPFSLPFSLSFSSLHRESSRSLQLQHAQLGRPLLTTITLHLLCQKKVCAGPLQTYWQHSLTPQPFLHSNPPTLRYKDGWISSVLECYAEELY